MGLVFFFIHCSVPGLVVALPREKVSIETDSQSGKLLAVWLLRRIDSVKKVSNWWT